MNGITMAATGRVGQAPEPRATASRTAMLTFGTPGAGLRVSAWRVDARGRDREVRAAASCSHARRARGGCMTPGARRWHVRTRDAYTPRQQAARAGPGRPMRAEAPHA